MTDEINTRRTAKRTVCAVKSGQRAGTVGASVRGRTESTRQNFNRYLDPQNLMVEMLPLVKRIAL